MPFKDDIRQLAELKQQISQKMILLRSTVTFRQCAAQVISSFVVFAVLDLRVGECLSLIHISEPTRPY